MKENIGFWFIGQQNCSQNRMFERLEVPEEKESKNSSTLIDDPLRSALQLDNGKSIFKLKIEMQYN